MLVSSLLGSDVLLPSCSMKSCLFHWPFSIENIKQTVLHNNRKEWWFWAFLIPTYQRCSNVKIHNQIVCLFETSCIVNTRIPGKRYKYLRIFIIVLLNPYQNTSSLSEIFIHSATERYSDLYTHSGTEVPSRNSQSAFEIEYSENRPEFRELSYFSNFFFRVLSWFRELTCLSE